MNSRYQIEEDQPQNPASSSRYAIEEDQPSSGSGSQDQAYYPAQAQMPLSSKLERAGGIAIGDIAKIPGKIGNLIERAGNAAPSEALGAAGQLLDPENLNPLTSNSRAAKNIGVFGSDFEKGAVNAIPSMSRYMAHLGLLPEKDVLQPWMNKEPYGEYLRSQMGQPQAGDALIQSIPKTLLAVDNPIGSFVGKGIESVAGGIKNIATGEPKYAALAQKLGSVDKQQALSSAAESKSQADQIVEDAKSASKQEIGKVDPDMIQYEINNHNENLAGINQNISALHHQIENIPEGKEFPQSSLIEAKQNTASAEQNLSTQQELQKQAKKDYKQIKSNSLQTIGKSNPDLIEHEINAHNNNLIGINQNIEALNHQMDNLTPVSKLPESDTSHIENSNNATNARIEAEKNLDAANAVHDQANNGLNSADATIADHLNYGENHRVLNAVALQRKVEDLENHASDRYQAVIDKNANSEFSMPIKRDYKNSFDSISENMERIRKGESPSKISSESEISPELQHLHDLAPTPQDTNISDFMTKAKDFSKVRNSYLANLRDAKSAENQRARMKAYEDSKGLQDIIEKTIEKGLGKEDAKEFKKAKGEYRDIVYPLRNNKHVIQAKKGTLPRNMLDAFSAQGEKQIGVGQELVRQIVLNDPEMLKNALGQQKLKDIIAEKPSALLKPYIEKSPELKALLETRKNYTDSVNKSKDQLSEAEQKHADAVQKENEAKSAAKTKEGEISAAQQEYEKQLKEYEKNRNNLQTQLSKQIEDKKDRENKIKELQENSKNINLTLKQKLEAEKKVFEAKKEHAIASKNEKELTDAADAHNKEMKDNQYARDKLQKELATHYNDKKVIEDRLPLLKRNAENLNQTIAQQKAAKESYDNAKSALRDVDRQIKRKHFGYKFLRHVGAKIGRTIPVIKGWIPRGY